MTRAKWAKGSKPRIELIDEHRINWWENMQCLQLIITGIADLLLKTRRNPVVN